jgi:hypothetical protein
MRSYAWTWLLLLLVVGAPGVGRGADRGADGRFDRRHSSHFLLYQDVAIDHQTGPRGSREFERGVLAELEAAYRRLDQTLGLRPQRPIEVVIYDPGVFDATFAGLFRFPAAGFYGGTIRVRGDVAVTPALSHTLRHELVHAALDAAAPSLVLPGWLNEGLAEWFEARSSGERRLAPRAIDALARGAATGAWIPIGGSLSRPGFGDLPPERAALAYLESYALIDLVERTRGERSLRDLVERMTRTGDVERSLERAAGVDSTGLERSLRAELGL